MNRKQPHDTGGLWDVSTRNAKPPTSAERKAIATLYAKDRTLGPVGISDRLRVLHGISVSPGTVVLWYRAQSK